MRIMEAMDRLMSAKKLSTRFASFVTGLGAVAAIWPAGAAYRYPHSSASEALRGDGFRVGADLKRVIDRQKSSGMTAKN